MRLNRGNTVDGTELGEDISLRGETFGFPLAKVVGGHGGDDLKVQAAAAHDALNGTLRLERREVLGEDFLSLLQRSLVVIRRPLAALFASDGVEAHTLGCVRRKVINPIQSVL